MFIDINRIVNICSNACEFHSRLIRNILEILAERNFEITKKIMYLSKRTIKEKLLAYLTSEAENAGSTSFVIPFNRQELADYLFVDRSAMSNALCKLRDEGIIEFNKNNFKLIANP